MRRRRNSALPPLRAWLPWALVSLAGGLACRTSPPPAPPAAPASAEPSPPPPPTRVPSTSAPQPEPAPATTLPHTCSITAQFLEPDGVTGEGRSDTSNRTAKQTAWDDACEQLQRLHDLDCRDSTQVAVHKEGSSTLRIAKGDGSSVERWEHRVTLTRQRQATGFSDAPERETACRQAKEHACQQLVGGPCPADGIRVLKVDGRPPRPVTPPAPPGSPEPPTTI